MVAVGDPGTRIAGKGVERPAAVGELDHGPAELFGARGQGLSLYNRDPDGNTVELRHYGD